MTGCWIVARATLREAARNKILWAACAVSIGLLGFFGASVHFQIDDFNTRATAPSLRYEMVSATMMVGLYAVDLLAVLMTVLISVATVPGQISTGTVHWVAMHPVPRWQFLIGTWLGFAAVCGIFVTLNFAATFAVIYGIAGVAPVNPIHGGLLVVLECLLVLTVTVMLGTWLSTFATAVIVLALLGVAFVGGWLEQVTGFTETTRMATLGIVTSLIMPTESLWRRAAFEMQTPLASSLPYSPFAGGSIPNAAMLRYAIFYLITALFVALYHYERREQ